MTLTEIAVVLATKLNMQYDTPFLLITKELVKVWRQTITIQRLKSNPKDRVYFTQSIVMDMIKVSEAECSDLGVAEDCIMRTKDKIPALVRTDVLFDYVGSENFRNPYSVTTPLQLRFIEYERKKNGVKFIWRNEYLYIYNSKAPKTGITTIFAYPEYVQMCNQKRLGEDECDEYDVEYKCPGDVVQAIIQSISAVDYRLQAPDQNKEEIKPVNQ